MPEQQVADLESLVASMEERGGAPSDETLAEIAEALAKQFGVDADEVAVLKFVPKFKSLKFVLPIKLSPVGTIPVTSTSALAAKTARERKPDLMNNFSSARHANVFEAVPLGRDPSELIHKIMSAPILEGTKIFGVVQICRKASSLAAAGPDFTPKDLKTLAGLSATLQRFLSFCKAE
jgi:GAF domain-containing protein